MEDNIKYSFEIRYSNGGKLVFETLKKCFMYNIPTTDIVNGVFIPNEVGKVYAIVEYNGHIVENLLEINTWKTEPVIKLDLIKLLEKKLNTTFDYKKPLNEAYATINIENFVEITPDKKMEYLNKSMSNGESPIDEHGNLVSTLNEKYYYLPSGIIECENSKAYKEHQVKLYEGLICTYPPQQTYNILNNSGLIIPSVSYKFTNIVDELKHGEINPNSCLFEVSVLTQNKDKVIHLMDTCGYYLNKETINGDKCVLKFYPKYDVEVTDIIKDKIKILYHMTKTKTYEDKILKNGLCPKSGGKVGKHPEVIFFTTKVFSVMELFTDKDNGMDANGQHILLEIDLSEKNPYRFFVDLRYPNAVYTYDNIAPQYITPIGTCVFGGDNNNINFKAIKRRKDMIVKENKDLTFYVKNSGTWFEEFLNVFTKIDDNFIILYDAPYNKRKLKGVKYNSNFDKLCDSYENYDGGDKQLKWDKIEDNTAYDNDGKPYKYTTQDGIYKIIPSNKTSAQTLKAIFKTLGEHGNGGHTFTFIVLYKRGYELNKEVMEFDGDGHDSIKIVDNKEELNEENHHLKYQTFDIPSELYQNLYNRWKKVENNPMYSKQDGYKRLHFIIKNKGKGLSYEFMKRCKNFFDHYKGMISRDIVGYLNGGKEFRDWINNTLDVATRSVEMGKKSATKSGVNGFIQSHYKDDGIKVASDPNKILNGKKNESKLYSENNNVYLNISNNKILFFEGRKVNLNQIFIPSEIPLLIEDGNIISPILEEIYYQLHWQSYGLVNIPKTLDFKCNENINDFIKIEYKKTVINEWYDANIIINLSNGRNIQNQVLYEALGETYPFERVKEQLFKLFPPLKYRVKDGDNKIYIQLPSNKEDAKLLHDKMDAWGYFMKNKRKDGDEWLYGDDFIDTTHFIFEPKYSYSTTNESGVYYYITPTIYLENKISKIGLSPRSQSKGNTYHPEFVYLLEDGGDYEGLMEELFIRNEQDFKHKKFYSVLEVKLPINDIKLYKDNNTPNGVYTLNNIPPEVISEIGRYEFDENGNYNKISINEHIIQKAMNKLWEDYNSESSNIAKPNVNTSNNVDSEGNKVTKMDSEYIDYDSAVEHDAPDDNQEAVDYNNMLDKAQEFKIKQAIDIINTKQRNPNAKYNTLKSFIRGVDKSNLTQTMKVDLRNTVMESTLEKNLNTFIRMVEDFENNKDKLIESQLELESLRSLHETYGQINNKDIIIDEIKNKIDDMLPIKKDPHSGLYYFSPSEVDYGEKLDGKNIYLYESKLESKYLKDVKVVIAIMYTSNWEQYLKERGILNKTAIKINFDNDGFAWRGEIFEMFQTLKIVISAYYQYNKLYFEKKDIDGSIAHEITHYFQNRYDYRNYTEDSHFNHYKQSIVGVQLNNDNRYSDHIRWLGYVLYFFSPEEFAANMNKLEVEMRNMGANKDNFEDLFLKTEVGVNYYNTLGVYKKLTTDETSDNEISDDDKTDWSEIFNTFKTTHMSPFGNKSYVMSTNNYLVFKNRVIKLIEAMIDNANKKLLKTKEYIIGGYKGKSEDMVYSTHNAKINGKMEAKGWTYNKPQKFSFEQYFLLEGKHKQYGGLDYLKKHQVKLTPEETKYFKDNNVLYFDNGKTKLIHKSIGNNGEEVYWATTHRAWQCSTSKSDMVTKANFVKTTS
jgi:peroxiredoxin